MSNGGKMRKLSYTFIRLLSRLPFRVLYALSDATFYPLYYLARYRRKIVRKNLVESFPQLSHSEIEALEKKFYHFFCDLIFESCKMATISPDEIKRRMHFTNFHIANEMLAKGQSVAYFIGHFCNWEWMSSSGLWFENGMVVAQVYHKLGNVTMDRVIRQMRERFGSECVEMRQTARYMVREKSGGKPCNIALIADQSPRRKDIKHYTQFMNHTVPALVGPEKMVKHFGCAPLFVTVRRVKRGYYEVDFSLLSDDASSLPDYELTDLYYRRLQEEIQKQPECYLWTHNRFRYALPQKPDTE